MKEKKKIFTTYWQFYLHYCLHADINKSSLHICELNKQKTKTFLCPPVTKDAK